MAARGRQAKEQGQQDGLHGVAWVPHQYMKYRLNNRNNKDHAAYRCRLCSWGYCTALLSHLLHILAPVRVVFVPAASTNPHRRETATKQ